MDADSLERELREQLRTVRGAGERRTIAGLVREIGNLPADRARAALEIGAGLAGFSLRVGIEFLRAAPEAARLLEPDELRAWGEMGRRLATADIETGAQFFASGVKDLEGVPRNILPLLFQLCARQSTLSTSIALETFRNASRLARQVGDVELLFSVYETAVEIARRSARHSSEFLAATPSAVEALYIAGGTSRLSAARAAIKLAHTFAVRAGGIAADLWAALPASIEGLGAEDMLRLFHYVEGFLDRGGAAALNVLAAGGPVMRALPDAFDAWAELLREVAEQSNAALVALSRFSPAFFREMQTRGRRSTELALRIIDAAHDVARVDAEAAICCFRSGPQALRTTSIEQFERWAAEGLANTPDNARARRSYYALETRQSNESLSSGGAGLALEEVAQTLRLYIEGLTGRVVEVASLSSVPSEARIGDGRTIHLPSNVSEFGDAQLDFKLYKTLAAHAAGQIEFETRARDTVELRAAYSSIAELYAPENLDALDAFALDGYINDPSKSERALAPEEEARRQRERRRTLPADSDYRAVLALFPQKGLATRIFGTLENGRIDRRLRHAYRGLGRDLDLVRQHLRENRPRIAGLPVHLVPFELLFQITLCGGALDDSRAFYGQIVSELETIVVDYLAGAEASVGDTLMATSRVYSLFQSVVPEMSERQTEGEEHASDSQTSGAQDRLEQEEREETNEERERREEQKRRDARELFNAWANAENSEGEGENMFTGAERWSSVESIEQELEPDEVAYSYDEWDRELADTRVGWCRVVEKKVKRGDRNFVELTRSRYRGVISSIRYQFQLMKPENLRRIPNELDGDDYDLNAVIDFVMDRRADGRQSERLYTKRLRRERDVAVSFLLDQSSSTARTIGRHPLQPYTHPGRRIIEVEKEGLVLMSEALEAVGDAYSIYGFTSEGRRNVKFYVVKDFNESYTAEIEQRIGGINYQHNTRLGAAVRHAAARLKQQEARTRLLIVLSDGRPYDHDYGDARYAREDTREALRQARLDGITPFCITIDRDSETELRDLYGDVGYTIIDDVLSLPERMPAIYRRLTT